MLLALFAEFTQQYVPRTAVFDRNSSAHNLIVYYTVFDESATRKVPFSLPNRL